MSLWPLQAVASSWNVCLKILLFCCFIANLTHVNLEFCDSVKCKIYFRFNFVCEPFKRSFALPVLRADFHCYNFRFNCQVDHLVSVGEIRHFRSWASTEQCHWIHLEISLHWRMLVIFTCSGMLCMSAECSVHLSCQFCVIVLFCYIIDISTWSMRGVVFSLYIWKFQSVLSCSSS